MTSKGGASERGVGASQDGNWMLAQLCTQRGELATQLRPEPTGGLRVVG